MAKILVVDDEPPTVRLLILLLQQDGHVTRSAGCGKSAVQVLESEQFDLLVLDMNLPVIPGDEVLRLCRHKWPNLAVICVTGFASVRHAVRSIQRGAVDYLPKPFHNGEFLTLVRRALGAGGRGAEHSLRAEATDSPNELPAIGFSNHRIPGDLRPAVNLLTTLGSLRATKPHRSTSEVPRELWRYRLLTLIVSALTAEEESSSPVFWAFARALRITFSAPPDNLLLVADEIQQMVRNSVEMVHLRPATWTIVHHLEAQMIATAGRFTLQHLCRDLGLNRNHVSSLLSADTGLNFRQWRWAILMRSAVRQLATSAEHVRQIAFLLGYEHSGQFDRDFRRMFGMTPVPFRRLAQGGAPEAP